MMKLTTLMMNMALMMAMELVMMIQLRTRLVKTGNMRRGGVGDTRVFPREYQSGTSAPTPENVTSSKKMGHLPAQQNSRKSHLLLEYRSDFKDWNPETRLGKYSDPFLVEAIRFCVKEVDRMCVLQTIGNCNF